MEKYERLKYTVLLDTEEIIECNNLKVLYDAVRRRMRMGETIVAKFYKNLPDFSFEGVTPFFQMAN